MKMTKSLVGLRLRMKRTTRKMTTTTMKKKGKTMNP